MTITMPTNPSYNRGDVLLVLFPNSNLTTSKMRPALVVQANNLATGLPQVVIAMITSQTIRLNHPSRVFILRTSSIGKQSGLLTDSVVMTDNLATITHQCVMRVIGSVPLGAIDIALKHTLGLQ